MKSFKKQIYLDPDIPGLEICANKQFDKCLKYKCKDIYHKHFMNGKKWNSGCRLNKMSHPAM